MRHTRRTVLAGLGTAALCGLAGCSSLPGFGDGDDSPRQWLYDPTAYTDGEVNRGIWFESPATLAAAENDLHSDVQDLTITPLYGSAFDRESVDWAILYVDHLLKTPGVRACSGSFDDDAAREATASILDKSVDDGTSVGSVDGYELVAYEEDQYGLYRDGEVANLDFVASEGEVRNIVAERTDSSSGLADSVRDLVDRIGFETTASVDFKSHDGTEFTGHGYGYSVDGETTTVRHAHLNGDLSLDDYREFGGEIDALSDVTVDEDGDVRWMEGTVETRRLAFDGTLFTLLRAPYE